MALLAALIIEHNLIAGMLDYPSESSEQIVDLVDAHGGAAKALAVWRAAGVLA